MMTIGIDIGGTSVKAAFTDADGRERTARSGPYQRPDRSALAAAVREAVDGLGPDIAGADRVGLCVPGRRAAAGDQIELAVNVPGLQGYRFDAIVRDAIGREVRHVAVSDAEAATFDAAAAHAGSVRVLGIAIGTGVGACLLEDGVPVRVGSGSIGHLGQIDMGPIGGAHPLGPDGGRGSLEAYLGIAALRARLGDGIAARLGTLPPDDPAVIALVRAVRVALAVYTPDLVLLLGGVGVALAPIGPMIEGQIRADLTRVAPAGWHLRFGTSLFHAALGAARLAAVYPDMPEERK
jgi:glucokinase